MHRMRECVQRLGRHGPCSYVRSLAPSLDVTRLWPCRLGPSRSSPWMEVKVTWRGFHPKALHLRSAGLHHLPTPGLLRPPCSSPKPYQLRRVLSIQIIITRFYPKMPHLQPGSLRPPSTLRCLSRQPTPPEETPNFKSAVDDVYARMSVSMRKLIADHAATKKLYAERVQRESEVRNLTVEDAFCDIDDRSSRSWKGRKAALLASQSVVGLSSFSGERRIRVCSGFVIRWNSYASTCKILTSATLVGSPSGHNCVIPDVRVKVCLPSGSISDGLITMIDFHYNIAVVEVKSDQKLPKAFLLRDVSSRGAVLAIGRFYDDGRLMCSQGKISKQTSTFECSELLVSSCKITMAGVGGPLVNYSGDVLGINFSGDNHTPYLSMAVVSRCLEHHRNYGKIIRPWLGFWCTSLELLPLRVLEHVYKKFQYSDKGLYISKVDKGSPADAAGLCVGDVLIKCAGKVPSTTPEFGALLLDISKEHMEMGNREINGDSLRGKITVEVTVRKEQDGRTVRKTLAADVLKEFNYYRWPAPMPTYNNCKVMARKQFMQWL